MKNAGVSYYSSHEMNFIVVGNRATFSSEVVRKIKKSDECFVYMKSIIMQGEFLEDHCVVDTGAVITDSFPVGSIIAIIPTKLICTVD